jgi:hypothetical protein
MELQFLELLIDDLLTSYATGGNQAQGAVEAFNRRFATPGLAQWLVRRPSSNTHQ